VEGRRRVTLLLALTLALVAPNPALTPGVVRPMTKAQVCSTVWGLDRRHVTVAMKQQVAKAYGVPWSDRAKYEFDHLVPREIGGADDVRNIWPQPLAEARHIKDPAENRIHRAVCAGDMSLHAAQEQMRHWGQR
jgi:hypothetical protein